MISITLIQNLIQNQISSSRTGCKEGERSTICVSFINVKKSHINKMCNFSEISEIHQSTNIFQNICFCELYINLDLRKQYKDNCESKGTRCGKQVFIII